MFFRSYPESISFYSWATFAWLNPSINLARSDGFVDNAAPRSIFPSQLKSKKLQDDFEKVHSKVGLCGSEQSNTIMQSDQLVVNQGKNIWIAMITLYWHCLFLSGLWTMLEVVVRLLSPLILRQLLLWLQASKAGDAPPVWQGWLLALALGSGGFFMSFLHHQLFFEGMVMGFNCRQALIASIHTKILKLNAACITQISNGHVVNLVSNDVRRLDDFWPFWSFLWAGPLELLMVLLMISAELGFIPAFLGCLTMMSMIPLQALLARPVAQIRLATAKKTDERVRLTSEVINGALAVKMLSWEVPVAEKISKIRSEESKYLKKMANIKGSNSALTFCCVPAAAFVTFFSAAYFNGSINIPSVFFCLSLLALPRLYMVQFFVMAVSSLSELRVSVRRLSHFLSMPEPAKPSSDNEGRAKGSVSFRGSSFDWTRPLGSVASKPTEDDTTHHLLQPVRTPSLPTSHTLEGLQLNISPGELVGITGSVGSGKSSLLQVLLGELLPLSDELGPIMTGSSAYSAQNPWIMSGTLRENVCFGSTFNQEQYDKVVESCSLEEDIANLPDKDQTEIGERGVNLSGGQKARLSLARCAYAAADIQLLDDPLSAVDPLVARVLFDEAIRGIMGGSTRLLVTHQRHFLPKCDKILVLREGKAVGFGTWDDCEALGLRELEGVTRNMGVSLSVDNLVAEEEDIKASGTIALNGHQEPQEEEAGESLTQLQAGIEDDKATDHPEEDLPLMIQGQESKAPDLTVLQAPGSFLMGRSDRSHRFKSFGAGLTRLFSMRPPGPANPMLRGNSIRMTNIEAKEVAGQLVEKEGRSTGSVPLAVYLGYFKALGINVAIFLSLAFLTGQAAFLASDIWLSKWASQQGRKEGQPDPIWLKVYGILVASIIFLSFLRALLFFNVTISASTAIHDEMAFAVLCAPLSFFHTNPSGRILNRFSKDLSSADDVLPMTAFDVFQTGFQVLGTLILVSWAVPFILPFFLPLALLFWLVRSRYIAASREVKRWEATTKSPIFDKFSASLKGLTTIRAFNSTQRFHGAFLTSLDDNAEWYFLFLGLSRWIGSRLDFLSACTLTATTLLAMATHDQVDPALLGLALTYSLSLTGSFQWLVRQVAEVENAMTSVERTMDYCSQPQEEDKGKRAELILPSSTWPASGALRFESVTCIYRPGLPPVLDGLSFNLPASCTCGIVGRTGSGKSSLMLALFRLIPTVRGRILLDGVDISSLPLQRLRSQLAIIPQDPVLFSGTVRSNLDPWSKFSDADLWSTLDRVNLKSAFSSDSLGLDTNLIEAGENLSVGQRQLFCLARALLQKAKILALDEATANTDSATDAIVQSSILDFTKSSENSQSVLLVIAHRIDTIMGADMLIVLGNGKLLEQGNPRELAVDPKSSFGRMVTAAAANKGQTD